MGIIRASKRVDVCKVCASWDPHSSKGVEASIKDVEQKLVSVSPDYFCGFSPLALCDAMKLRAELPKWLEKFKVHLEEHQE